VPEVDRLAVERQRRVGETMLTFQATEEASRGSRYLPVPSIP
jgi:hypothetical protein